MLLVNVIFCFSERSARARRGRASPSGANQERAGGRTRGEVYFEFHRFGDCFNSTVYMTSSKVGEKKEM